MERDKREEHSPGCAKYPMKRFLTLLLLACLMLVSWIPQVHAQETPQYYNPEDDKLTHLELLEKLCTGFPYVGYEKYPEAPQYFQQDYAHVPYGGYSGNIATHGCGITTLAMLATYMTDTELTPEDLADDFWRYSSDEGTAFAMFDDSPGMLGYYLEKRSRSLQEAEAALREGKMVVSLQFADHFTSTAHFILLYGITEDGKILIRDGNVYNHTRRFAGTDLYETGFDPGYVHAHNRYYWIYEKKVVRTPGCSRCADPEVETVPVCRQAYYCAKCTKLLTTQQSYRDALAAVQHTPEI